jgi:hypothetical protein
MPNFPEEHNYMVMHALDSNDLTFIVKLIGVGNVQDEILNKEKLYAILESKRLKVEEQLFGVLVVIDDSLPKGSRARLHADAPLVFNLRDMTGVQVILD